MMAQHDDLNGFRSPELKSGFWVLWDDELHLGCLGCLGCPFCCLCGNLKWRENQQYQQLGAPKSSSFNLATLLLSPIQTMLVHACPTLLAEGTWMCIPGIATRFQTILQHKILHIEYDLHYPIYIHIHTVHVYIYTHIHIYICIMI